MRLPHKYIFVIVGVVVVVLHIIICSCCCSVTYIADFSIMHCFNAVRCIIACLNIVLYSNIVSETIIFIVENS